MKLSQKTLNQFNLNIATEKRIRRLPKIPRIDRADIVKSLSRQRAIFEKARAETERVIASNAVAKAIDTELKNLRKMLTAPPQPAADAVTVRVIGIIEQANKTRRMPLAGLTVRLKSDKLVPVESETDIMGVSVLRPEVREEKPEKIDIKAEQAVKKRAPTKVEKKRIPAQTITVEVLAPNATVLVSKRARISPKKPPALIVEVAKTASLKASFAKGAVWIRAEDAAQQRAKELKALTRKALKGQRDELAKIMQDLTDALDKNSR